MDASLSWIKALVPGLNPASDQEFMDRMTLTGSKGEGYHRLDHNLDRIVTGQVKEVKPHPDANKLVICQVDVGESNGGVCQIVTGAPNVAEGQKVIVVLDGGKVAGGHDGGPLPEEGIPIKAGKLRGVDSCGMMCSIEELGSSRDYYPEAPEGGIYILPENAPVGGDPLELLGLHDTIFSYEITSNRVDCYSILGIAREAAATYELPFVPPEVTVTESEQKASDYASVEVVDADLCTRYCARIVTDVTIGDSPAWMQHRLASCGIRPINNFVDITNYVMLEYGQPMHAFDLDTIAGHRIVVQRAQDGDSFVTLDGQERKLDRDVLMICDGEKQIGIAGIMGGENSMITERAHTVLFEAACFNGPNIRKSAKRIGLRTDASGFFEKGLDPANAEAAINRACQLVTELGCGKVAQGILEAGAPLAQPKRIALDVDRINGILGTDIGKEEMIGYLARVEVPYDAATNEFVIPSFRQDLNGLCDIAEEVARFYGYDRIPSTLPAGSDVTGGITFSMRIEDKAREVAQFCGFSEGYCYSFESPKVFDRLRMAEDAPERQAIRISNPLGEDFSLMRTQTLNGMLTSLGTNYKRRNKSVRLFEIGNIYLPKALPLTDYPDERKQLTLGFYVSDKNDGDFFEMKGVVEEFLSQLGFAVEKLVYDRGTRPYLHPGRQAEVSHGDVRLGFLGEIHPLVAEEYGIGARAYVAVLDLPAIEETASFDRVYQGLARFPAVSRDISMVVPRDVTAGQIERIIRQRGGKILESLLLFDIYEGEQIREGFKSMAYALSFRDPAKTLEDADVNATMKKILNGLQGLNIELRS